MTKLNLDSLSSSEKQELLALIEERARRKGQNKLASYYPDDGPLRRELYTKHMEFFRAGATYRERCFMAGNRIGKCTTANTLIDTPNGPVRVIDLRDGDLVMAWDGEKKVAQAIEAPFEKPGLHECALIVMSDGRTIEAADHHRILFSDGWRLLSECLPQSFFFHHRSSLEPFRTARVLSGRRWIGIAQGFLSRCLAGSRPCGAQPLADQGIDQGAPPLPVDARQYIFQPALQGGSVRKDTDSPFDAKPHRSILDALRQRAGRFVASIVQAAYKHAAPNPLIRRGGLLRLAVASVALRLVGAVAVPALRAGSSRTWTWATPDVDGNEIIAVIPIGRHKVYDFTVPGYHNYCAGGLVHHNTEGAGGYETTLHLTGRYPKWWDGRVFPKPVKWWAGGKTNETTRDIVQAKLFGKVTYRFGRKTVDGTGLVPGDCIGNIAWKQGVQDLIDTIQIKHVMGGWSTLGLKSYQQGRGAFEGTEQDGIWLDEEPPLDIYGECLIRTATTNGIVMMTFTPLDGLTETVMTFLPSDLDLEKLINA
jgi:phage terminase large subunit-like protein